MEPLVNTNEIDISPDPIEIKTIEETLVKDEDPFKPIQSPNFKSGEVGWRASSNGLFEANGAMMSNVGSGSFYASTDGISFDILISYVDGVITSIV